MCLGLFSSIIPFVILNVRMSVELVLYIIMLLSPRTLLKCLLFLFDLSEHLSLMCKHVDSGTLWHCCWHSGCLTIHPLPCHKMFSKDDKYRINFLYVCFKTNYYPCTEKCWCVHRSQKTNIRTNTFRYEPSCVQFTFHVHSSTPFTHQLNPNQGSLMETLSR